MTDPMPENTATEHKDDRQDEDRRNGPRDRRSAKKDRRDPERVSDEIAPRRHPDINGRRNYDD
jgi:hypothetical protein